MRSANISVRWSARFGAMMQLVCRTENARCAETRFLKLCTELQTLQRAL
jgi:hypothetical protein